MICALGAPKLGKKSHGDRPEAYLGEGIAYLEANGASSQQTHPVGCNLARELQGLSMMLV